MPEDDWREVNHSCNPNTWWPHDGALSARVDIPAGEEIPYDYASCDIDLEFQMNCACGTDNCRKTVCHRDHLNPHWQAQYKGSNGQYFLPAHTVAAIKRNA